MATYPTEQYPHDSAILELNGQTDEATGLDYVARGTSANSTPPYEVQYNRRLQRANGILAALRQGMVVDEGNLKFGVYPIEYRLGGTAKSFDGATDQSLDDDETTFVWLNSSNALTTGASFPGDPATFLPLAKIVTASGQATITDLRTLALFDVGT